MRRVIDDEIGAINGQQLRRSDDSEHSRAAIRMASAWASANVFCLRQCDMSKKSNEITAIALLQHQLGGGIAPH